MSRESLHELLNRIPKSVSPAYRAASAAPPDDEPVTEDDALAIERTAAEIRAGKVIPHEDVLREFGLA